MTAEIRYLRALRRLRREQASQEHISQIGARVRIRVFRIFPSFPWVVLNQHALEKGKIISESGQGDRTEYTVRFQNGGQPCWDRYPADAVKILSEIK